MLSCVVFANFWESAQKPPNGHACAARQHINVDQFWVFGWSAWRWVAFRQAILYACDVLCCFLELFRVLRLH